LQAAAAVDPDNAARYQKKLWALDSKARVRAPSPAPDSKPDTKRDTKPDTKTDIQQPREQRDE
jgi:hypothetical protein